MDTSSAVTAIHQHAASVRTLGRQPVVLFDVGGVLAPDVWETVLLAPGGVADRHGLDPDLLERAGAGLWAAHAVTSRPLHEYLDELSDAVGSLVSEQMWHEAASATLAVMPGAARLVQAAIEAGCRIGLVSNNTAPFWAMQRELLGELLAPVEAEIGWLSHLFGAQKPELFETAFEVVDARDVLYFDDRQGNVDEARRRGARAELVA